MKKILLLFSGSTLNPQHKPEVLRDLLQTTGQGKGLDVQVDAALYEDLLYVVAGRDSRITHLPDGKDIAGYDFVYQRRWEDKPDQALACAIYLKNKGVDFADSESYRTSSVNKLTQAWRFWEAGLPHPKTAFAGGNSAAKSLLSKMDLLPFGFPFIAKELNGAGGRNNYLVTSQDQFEGVLQSDPSLQFILQEQIENDGDYRILVCGDSVRLAMHRKAADGKHTNNTSQGGRAELTDPASIDQAIIADAVKAAKLLGRDIAGVDAVVDKRTGKHYFFEVNRCPQIETGFFDQEKADELIEYLYSGRGNG